MYGLTVYRPWSCLIAWAKKPIENRKWAPPPELLKPGDWFAIHAGKKWDPGCIPYAAERGVPVARFAAEEVAKEGVVAVAQFGGLVHDLAACTEAERPWYFGPPAVGWRLIQVVPIDPPVPARGNRKLWKLRDDSLEAVRAAYARARRP